MTTLTDNTLFIEVATGTYPVTFAMIRELKKANVSFGPNPPIDDVRQFGYEPVADSVIPTGDVVTEGVPELVEGVWTRTWVVRSLSPAEVSANLQGVKSSLSAQVDQLRDEAINYGMRYVFPDGSTGGVQMRPKDRTNLIGMRLEAEAYLALNMPEATMAFRSLENVTRELPVAEIVKLTDAATNHTKLVYAASWALKDQINSATTADELPVIPGSLI